MRELVNELGGQIDESKVRAILVIVDIQGRETPLMAALGDYRKDPYRALIAIERFKGRISREIDRVEGTQDFGESFK